MKKIVLIIGSLLFLVSLSACQKSPEERFIGYFNDIGTIVAEADDCGKAARKITEYTEKNQDNIVDDLTLILNQAAKDEKEGKESPDDSPKMKKLNAEMEALKGKIENCKCKDDKEIKSAMTKFSAIIFGTAMSIAFKAIKEEKDADTDADK